ncbi:hypothetical protein [Roseivirga pacifica]|uniref:hypothetical protein n=1 Tax=Roseivirga pacifica TaxID=1267423 RepID=UPI003BB0B2F0
MRRTTIIFVAIAVTIGVWVGLRLLTYQPISASNDLYDAGFIDNLDDLSTTVTSRFETKETITGIEIYVDGQLSGAGIVRIGTSDSVAYRDYQVASGVVDIDHKSDWYSQVCFVTFIPTRPTKGKIEINCNFIGH